MLKHKIDKSAKWYLSEGGFTDGWINFYKFLQDYRFKSIREHIKGKSVLEVGIAEGEVTSRLVRMPFKLITCVEASKEFIEKFPVKDRRIKIYHSFIEDFKTNKKFDVILLCHIIEHVKDPLLVLKNCRKMLSKNGRIIVMVPNRDSIHRLVAVKMGLLKRKDSLNQRDKSVGHRRIYSIETLEKDLKKSSLKIIDKGGIFYKPLSNEQIEKNWTKKMMDGFYELGKDFPENAAEIYAVCRK